jgi:hypothetical protein
MRLVRVLGDLAEIAVVLALKLLFGPSDGGQPPRETKRPLSRLPASLSLEVYCSAMRIDGGQDAILLFARGLEWMEHWGGWIDFGEGPHAPLYLVIPDRADKPVKGICFNTAGEIGVLFRYLKNHPPFDEEGQRRDLTMRLNRIWGIRIPPGRWNGRAHNVKLDALRVPAAQNVFFEIFDDVARRLQAPRP